MTSLGERAAFRHVCTAVGSPTAAIRRGGNKSVKTGDWRQRVFDARLLERHFYFRHLDVVRKTAEALGGLNICNIYVVCSFEIASNMPVNVGTVGEIKQCVKRRVTARSP